ncbi:MAG: type II secretion system protein GspG [Planctomycetes bacterium]|nr:type II secretion system protein GspG [Planctomycetota bacterium]
MRHGNTGYTLLEMMIALTIIAAFTGITTIAGGEYMQFKNVDATRSEMNNLASAIRAYYRDTDAFPGELRDLLENVPVVANWHGPYISTDNKGLAGGYLRDSWEHNYIYSVLDYTTFQLRSYGRNGVDNGGSGDDISKIADVQDIVRTITMNEVAELNEAIEAYNIYQLPASPLSTSYSSMMNTLTSKKYLNNSDGHLDWDGWCNPYVPGTTPVQNAKSNGN